MTRRGGGGLGRLVDFVVVLAFYELVGLLLYLVAVDSAVLTALLDSGSLDGLVATATGVVLARPDVLAVAVGIGLFAGVVVFVQEETPGVPDLFGPDAPRGIAYPFYVLQVGVGVVVGTLMGAVLGFGFYLSVVRPGALGGGEGTADLADAAWLLVRFVATNPDALLGALVGGGLGFWSGYTGRIWARRDPHDQYDDGYDGGGFGGFGGFGGGGDGGGDGGE